jgi:hypothetical protein
MTHLRPAEFVELVEGSLAADRAAHAERCARCRDEAERLRAVLAEVGALEVPEPSALFWERFSARVRADVAAERARPLLGLPAWRPMFAALVGAAVVVAAVVAGWRAWIGPETSPAPVVRSDTPAPASPAAADAAAPDTMGVPEWDALTSLVADLRWEDVAGATALAMRPGTAERAVAMLDDGERAELVRLLEVEVAGERR